MRPLRLLIVAPSLDMVGGQSIQAHLLVRHLRDEPSLQVEFRPINPRLPRPLRAIQRVKYARTLPTWSTYVAQLASAMRRCDIAHVFAASYFSFLLAPTPAILLGRWLGKPVVLNYHSGEASDHLERWPSAVRTLRLATRLAVPSDYLVEVLGRFGLQAQAVYNAVDLGAFRFRARARPEPAFLVNRSFEPHYNVACVLRAFALIQQRCPEATLTIAGDGPLRTELERLAADLGLRHARFVGRVRPENMPALYDQHDVWLNGSDVDNMPLSILEAYASGVAVVTTNAGGIPFIVADGQTGMVVQRNDVEGLAERALDVLARPDLFAELTHNGLAECAKYTWESVKPKWMELYSEVGLGGRLPAQGLP